MYHPFFFITVSELFITVLGGFYHCFGIIYHHFWIFHQYFMIIYHRFGITYHTFRMIYQHFRIIYYRFRIIYNRFIIINYCYTVTPLSRLLSALRSFTSVSGSLIPPFRVVYCRRMFHDRLSPFQHQLPLRFPAAPISSTEGEHQLMCVCVSCAAKDWTATAAGAGMFSGKSRSILRLPDFRLHKRSCTV